MSNRGPKLESAHHVKACRWSTAARSVTLEAIAALAVNCVCVRSPVPLVVAIGVAHSEARNHELANNGNWAALAVLEHAYAAAAGRRNLDAHALWRAEAAVAMPGACNLFRREQLRSLLSVAHGGGGALSWTSSRGGAYHGSLNSYVATGRSRWPHRNETDRNGSEQIGSDRKRRLARAD